MPFASGKKAVRGNSGAAYFERKSGKRWVLGLLAVSALLLAFLYPHRSEVQPVVTSAALAPTTATEKQPDDRPGWSPIPEGRRAEPDELPTVSMIAARGPDCMKCAKENGCLETRKGEEGGSCEEASDAPSACGPGLSEKAMCLRILQTAFTSHCAQTGEQTPCLCGPIDAAACLGGTETPMGPLYRDYACDFNTTDIAAILAKFKDPRFGAGQANALVQCLGAFSCDCFGN